MPLHILSCLVVLGHFQHSNDLQLEMVWGGIVQNCVILLWTNAPSYALAHNCYCRAYLSSSRFYFCLLCCHLRQMKIWKIIRRRGLAVWWFFFGKIIINIFTFLDQTNDLVMFRPIHINSSQLICACQGTFKVATTSLKLEIRLHTRLARAHNLVCKERDRNVATLHVVLFQAWMMQRL